MGRVSSGKQRLIEAAFNLVWEQSYGSVTIDAICERACVKKGSFYYFFDSKLDLVLQAINDKWDERRAFLKVTFAPGQSTVKRLLNYFNYIADHQIEFFQEVGFVLGCPYYRLASEISRQEEPIRQLIQEHYREFQGIIARTLSEAQNLGEIPMGNPESKAHLLLASWQGALSRARVENNPYLLHEFGQHVVELLQFQKTVREESPFDAALVDSIS